MEKDWLSRERKRLKRSPFVRYFLTIIIIVKDRYGRIMEEKEIIE